MIKTNQVQAFSLGVLLHQYSLRMYMVIDEENVQINHAKYFLSSEVFLKPRVFAFKRV